MFPAEAANVKSHSAPNAPAQQILRTPHARASDAHDAHGVICHSALAD